ncbi:hypothetical protein GGR34_000381 [Microvirga flocculans]|uniref:Uncharacterized protein n=1 Tax=Microvirga flocculans TaxID=217168 RepID=A0A7W6IC75_9HYPH|nr:hypothetical protein [Microvirga flocculans]MBB4038752.1 hypothetical protein [Microvirga flocculans]
MASFGQALRTVAAHPEAVADRSVIREYADEMRLPPAAESRAEAVFTTVGLFLVLAIVLSALWILLRARR